MVMKKEEIPKIINLIIILAFAVLIINAGILIFAFQSGESLVKRQWEDPSVIDAEFQLREERNITISASFTIRGRETKAKKDNSTSLVYRIPVSISISGAFTGPLYTADGCLGEDCDLLSQKYFITEKSLEEGYFQSSFNSILYKNNKTKPDNYRITIDFGGDSTYKSTLVSAALEIRSDRLQEKPFVILAVVLAVTIVIASFVQRIYKNRK